MTKIISVLLPLSLPEAFVYSSADELKLCRGDFVIVPLGRKEIKAVVWQTDVQSKTNISRIKPIISKIDIEPLPQTLCKFIDWVAKYTVSLSGNVLKMAMNTANALQPEELVDIYSVKDKNAAKITASRQKIIDALEREKLTLARLKEKSSASSAVIKNMVDKGILQISKIPPQKIIDEPNITPLNLSDHQEESAKYMREAVESCDFKAILLDGVTGSGKTEVYFSAIEESLKIEGSQSLIMLPEIALTAQIVKRFKARFGFDPVQWHSALTPKMREKNWRRIANGSARIIIGARSSLFLPYKNLRLIVIDEEHDSSYKQEEGVIYNARDMAVVRGSFDKFPVVLVSATPSIETVTNAYEGKYSHLKLHSRHGGAVLPNVSVVDMRKHKMPAGQWLSPELFKEITTSLDAGQQAMLFLNRRGYAPLKLCRHCGHRFQCPNCSSWLVEHRKAGILTCHHCDYHERLVQNCPECSKEDSLVSCGPGVERLAEEVALKFPQARLVTITGDSMTSITNANELLQNIESGNADIVIGTQVIAKGHHFPKLTLVGVVDADMGLEGGDLRASERCYQLLNQVSGRAGREKDKGKVIIQSYMPDNAVMNALVNYSRDDFIKCESESRKRTNMPPFSRLAGLVISGKNEEATQNYAKLLARSAPISDDIRLMGPVAAPLFLLRGNYRYRILIRSARNINIQKWITDLLKACKPHSSINLRVDVDPYSFL